MALTKKKELTWMSYGFQAYLKQIGPRLQKQVAEMLYHYMNQYEKMKKHVFDPKSRAYSWHVEIDKSIQQSFKNDNAGVTCRAGCCHCCKLEVIISDDEADLLVSYAKKENIAIDELKLKRQSNFTEWHQQNKEDWSCVFLDGNTGLCKVYEHRPNTCRKYFALSDPELCNVQNYPNGQVKNVIVNEAEILTAASMNVAKSGTMPRMLLERMNRE